MSTKICAWNVRGLNDPSRQREVAKFLKEDINIVGLLETKVIDSNHVRILNHVLHDWVSLTNYEHAILGRIWVCWNPVFCTIDVLDSSDQHMWCKIKDLNGDIHFFACFVYAQNTYGLRRPLFNKLEVLAQLYGDFPCILLGDFNAIRFPYEKSTMGVANLLGLTNNVRVDLFHLRLIGRWLMGCGSIICHTSMLTSILLGPLITLLVLLLCL